MKNIKKILKWTLITLVVLGLIGSSDTLTKILKHLIETSINWAFLIILVIIITKIIPKHSNISNREPRTAAPDNQEKEKYESSLYYQETHLPYYSLIADKGKYGEYITSTYLEKIPNTKLLFNAYIPTTDNNYTEVDIIAVTNHGIFVVENKNYSGWIYGHENEQNWCEVLYRNKYNFYNPVKQNQIHTKYIAKYLSKKYIFTDLHSIICFNQNATLKKIDITSPNIFVTKPAEIPAYIINKPETISKQGIQHIYDILKPTTIVSDEIKAAHIDRIAN